MNVHYRENVEQYTPLITFLMKTAYIEYGKNEKNKINLPGMP